MHGMEYRSFHRLNTMITVPSIVITLFGGAASTSQSSLIDLIGPSSEKYVPLVIGILSMFVSIMGSVSSFMKIPALTEQHLQAHISFGKLTRKIQSDIQVSPHDRSVPGKEACKKYEEMFVALMDIAPPVSKGTEARFSCRSDVKALNMVVPPLVKMGIVKTFTQLEAERMAQEEKIRAMLKAEIEEASQPRRPQGLRRGISTRFKNLGRRSGQQADRGRLEMGRMQTKYSSSSQDDVAKGLKVCLDSNDVRTVLPPVEEAATSTLRPPRQGGVRKQQKKLQRELEKISKRGTVSRVTATGSLPPPDDKEKSTTSDSEESGSSAGAFELD